MHPANPKETKKVIKSLKENKGIGANNISPVILRNFKKKISEPLCPIVTRCFE